MALEILSEGEKNYTINIQAKNHEVKKEHHNNFKELRNQIVTICRVKRIIIKNILQKMLKMQEIGGKVLKQ